MSHAVAIIGCGRMGRERAVQLRRLGATIALLVDESLEHARLLAADIPGARVATSLDDAGTRGLDALFVCTPPGSRRASVAAAAKNGLALFVEKPIATTLEDAAWMRDTTASAGIVTAVGYMNRYRRGVFQARRLAASSQVLGINCHWTCKPYSVPWWRQADQSGGPVNEQATHLVDLCRYVGGEIGHSQSYVSDNEETAGALFHFRSGALGTLLYSCGAPEKDIGLSVFTRDGAMHLDGWEFRLTDNTGSTAEQSSADDPFAAETRTFISALHSGDRSIIRSTMADAYETQRVVEQLRSGFGLPQTLGALR